MYDLALYETTTASGVNFCIGISPNKLVTLKHLTKWQVDEMTKHQNVTKKYQGKVEHA
jgi:hypothetical protein